MTTNAPETLTYTVSAECRAGGEAIIHARTSDIAFDGTVQSGDTLPGPADLLCAALCACVLKNVERFSQMLPFRYQSASMVVAADREGPPPRIVRMRYRLTIVTDEPITRVELLHKNIRKFGTITNTLAVACELSGEVEAIAPTGT